MSAQQLQALLEMAARNPPPAQASPAQLRAWFDAGHSRMPLAQGHPIQRLCLPDAGGGTMAAELLRPQHGDARRLVIYYHAGGFVFGSLDSHRSLCSYLAQFSGASVLNVAYRLAPEHPAPAAHEDALAAYRWALAQGYTAAAIALAGDSAGGNLALSTAVRARDQGLPLPAAVVALSPALDLAGEGASHHTVDDPFITRELMGFFNAMYVPGGDVRSPTVTPFYSADL